jgi:ABC-type dipeptide/oligopeptide/nickel transport system permease subunit
MNRIRRYAATALLMIFLCSMGAEFLAPAHYAFQFRNEPNATPSSAHLLGTDALGRDRLSRVIYGARVSLLLAPAAALVSSMAALMIGGAAGLAGGIWQRMTVAGLDLMLSLPWLFLLITVRAMLPLNLPPGRSAVVTFALLGLLGWAGCARIVYTGTRSILASGFVLQARAWGMGNFRLLFTQILPNLAPAILAQFWVSIPVFILAEANLGILGLGVSEPLPSWGNLLRELQDITMFHAEPWVHTEPWKLAPLLLLFTVVAAFQTLLSSEEAAK